jgi:phosphohistidine phosphatase SixA
MRPLLSASLILATVACGAAPSLAQSARNSHAAASNCDLRRIGQALREGGHVILVRHGATFSNQADVDPFNLADVSKQRNLNDEGKELARAFGEALRGAGVPIGKVYTSQFNRAYETAVLAGFKDIKMTADLSLVVMPDENNQHAKALRAMLAKAPEQGRNDILVTHRPNIVDALGNDWFDVEEGEASIFKPDGADHHLVARVLMEDWPKIAAAVR